MNVNHCFSRRSHPLTPDISATAVPPQYSFNSNSYVGGIGETMLTVEYMAAYIIDTRIMSPHNLPLAAPEACLLNRF